MTNPITVIVDALRAALGAGRPELATTAGFKAFGDKWFAWWSNAFEDHDGEFFAEKAIDEYVMRVDVGAVPKPELWFWHTPGTRHGQAEWVGRIGHFAVAAGSFDDTPLGKAAKAHYSNGNGHYGMSHGFTYDPGQKRDGVYHQFNTFELSVLPQDKAANPYTAFTEVFEMELTDEKRTALEAVFGAELTAQLIDATEEKSRAIEALDVRYKDFVRMDDPAPAAEHDHGAKEDGVDMPDEDEDTPVEDMPEDAAPDADKADMGAFVTAITEDVAALANVVNSLIGKLEAVQAEGEAEKARYEQAEAALRAEVKALREAVDLRPRAASTDPATEVEQSALTDAIKAQIEADDYETVLGLRVKRAR